MLPRESGISTKALRGGKVFISPKELEVEFNTQSKGKICGMGIKIKTIGIDTLSINKDEINLRAVEQIVDTQQVNAIGSIMKWAESNIMNKGLSFKNMIDYIICEIEKNGLISIEAVKGGNGSLAMPRKQEIMAAYNRYRNLKI